jgi:GntR family transcriptional regulator
VLEARRVVPEPDIAAALGLGARAAAFEVRRVRSANRVPVALETSWLPARLVPGLLDRTLSGSLYAVLRRHYGLEPLTAEEHLAPVLADDETAAHLDVLPGTPLMRVERTAHLADGSVVEFARDLFRADRVDFLVRRTPDEPVTLRAVSEAH